MLVDIVAGCCRLQVMVVISHELLYKRMGDPSDAVRLGSTVGTGGVVGFPLVVICGDQPPLVLKSQQLMVNLVHS